MISRKSRQISMSRAQLVCIAKAIVKDELDRAANDETEAEVAEFICEGVAKLLGNILMEQTGDLIIELEKGLK